MRRLYLQIYLGFIAHKNEFVIVCAGFSYYGFFGRIFCHDSS